MVDIYEAYKPLRNHLRKLELVESLGVIRAYVQHLQFRGPFPRDIEVPVWFLQAGSNVEKKVHEWELDVITRELLLNACSPAEARESLGRWRYFAGAVNKLKDLENHVAGLYPEGSSLLEMHRIAHRQFPWQRPPNASWLGRYYRIFSRPEVDAILQRTTALTAKDLYVLGLGFAGIYLSDFALYYPPAMDIPGLTLAHLDRFLGRFALDVDTLRARAGAAQELNENYAYVHNPLRYHPIIRLQLSGRDALAAPIPTFLYWRFTEGVYYELLNQVGFSAAYGDAFQAYVGDVIARGNRSRRLHVYPEAEYRVGRDRKDSVDWVIEDDTALLFVESKAKRMQLRAKSEIRTTETLDQELDKLASFAVQLYKTIADYQAGHYPHVAHQPRKPIFPLVLTLEDWFTFGPRIQGEINHRVVAHLRDAGLPEAWLEDMPYMTCSAAAFEKLIQVIDARSIAQVLDRAREPEFRGWLLDGFLSHVFPEESRAARDLFPETLEELTTGFPPP